MFKKAMQSLEFHLIGCAWLAMCDLQFECCHEWWVAHTIDEDNWLNSFIYCTLDNVFEAWCRSHMSRFNTLNPLTYRRGDYRYS